MPAVARSRAGDVRRIQRICPRAIGSSPTGSATRRPRLPTGLVPPQLRTTLKEQRASRAGQPPRKPHCQPSISRILTGARRSADNRALPFRKLFTFTGATPSLRVFRSTTETTSLGGVVAARANSDPAILQPSNGLRSDPALAASAQGATDTKRARVLTAKDGGQRAPFVKP